MDYEYKVLNETDIHKLLDDLVLIRDNLRMGEGKNALTKVEDIIKSLSER